MWVQLYCSDYPKSLINGINEVYIFKALYNASVTFSPALSMQISICIRGLIPRNFAGLAEAVPIGYLVLVVEQKTGKKSLI